MITWLICQAGKLCSFKGYAEVISATVIPKGCMQPGSMSCQFRPVCLCLACVGVSGKSLSLCFFAACVHACIWQMWQIAMSELAALLAILKTYPLLCTTCFPLYLHTESVFLFLQACRLCSFQKSATGTLWYCGDHPIQARHQHCKEHGRGYQSSSGGQDRAASGLLPQLTAWAVSSCHLPACLQ